MKRSFTFALMLGMTVATIWTVTTHLMAQQQEQRVKQQDQRAQPAPFQQLFRLRGVEFSTEQKALAEELRKKHAPMLTDFQRKLNGVYTQEQRQARRKAIQAARDAGKEGRALQQAVAQAVELSAEQKQQVADIRKQRDALTTKIQGELRGLLTGEQRKQLQRQQNRNAGNRRPATPPTHRNVKYGPYDRNVMDVWLAKSDKPTPVLVSIHGGGFRGGNKGVSADLLRPCLASGISVVAITYRLSDQAIAPAQFLDSARAIQFIRHNAKEWNLDPTRIAATGGSAGAGISLWLGFHDDLADPDSNDPVLRQSTRLTCMSVYNGQSSYDPRFIRDLFPGKDTYKHSALAQLYDVDLNKLDDLPKEKYKLFELVSAINHLTKDDPPAQLTYASRLDTPITNQGIGIHHPLFGKVLKEEMDKLDIDCHVHPGVRRGGGDWVKLTMDFLKKHLGVE